MDLIREFKISRNVFLDGPPEFSKRDTYLKFYHTKQKIFKGLYHRFFKFCLVLFSLHVKNQDVDFFGTSQAFRKKCHKNSLE